MRLTNRDSRTKNKEAQMNLHSDSHLDHGLTKAQIDYVLDLFKDKDAFFIATIELPVELGTTLCGLYGPIMGDSIMDEHVRMMRRGCREYESRVIDLPMRRDNRITVIAGPHLGYPCVLYTAFGGPISPQEPGDPGCKDRAVSEAFWAEHALSSSELPAPQ
jgi:hypothetical protein